MYNIRLWCSPAATVVVEKQYYTILVCVCSPSHPMQSTCAILSSVVCLAVPNFSTCAAMAWLSARGEGGGDSGHKICILIFSTMFLWNFSHFKRNSAGYYYKYTCLHVKYPLFLSDFNEQIFWTQFVKIPKYQFSWKSAPWEPNFSMHTEGQADRHDEANSHFLKFYERA